MDADSSSQKGTSSPRKVKFAPKARLKRGQRPPMPQLKESENDVDAAAQENLLWHLNESKAAKAKKRGAAQVASGDGVPSTTIVSYDASNDITMSQDQGSTSNGGSGKQKEEKEYKEPWDYSANYPVTLPLRMPNSGNPELLDKEEFGKGYEQLAYDECATNPVAELGLMEKNLDNLFFIQLPPMPIFESSLKPYVDGQSSNKTSVRGGGRSRKPSNLEALPAGFMGKMLVYKSGAVKLKFGDTVCDGSLGLGCVFAQEVVAMNTEEKHCCSIGELNKRVVITPDMDSILDSMYHLR